MARGDNRKTTKMRRKKNQRKKALRIRKKLAAAKAK